MDNGRYVWTRLCGATDLELVIRVWRIAPLYAQIVALPSTELKDPMLC